MNLITVIILLVLSMPWHSSSGQEVRTENWRKDNKMLPQYCKDRATNLELYNKKWKNRAGLGLGDFPMHHYCEGIYAEHLSRNEFRPGKRSNYLGTVRYQMQYSSKFCGAGCVLYPELHTRWGWALSQTGQAGEAIKHYKLALDRNPKYTGAYAKLADLYIELKQPEEARNILQSGLKVKPNSRMLKRRLEELGQQ